MLGLVTVKKYTAVRERVFEKVAANSWQLLGVPGSCCWGMRSSRSVTGSSESVCVLSLFTTAIPITEMCERCVPC